MSVTELLLAVPSLSEYLVVLVVVALKFPPLYSESTSEPYCVTSRCFSCSDLYCVCKKRSAYWERKRERWERSLKFWRPC